MRYTENRNGKWIVPKNLWEEAAEKLARYEDTEEWTDIEPLILQLRKAADEEKTNNPVTASLLSMAADFIVRINVWDNSQAKAVMEKQDRRKKEIFAFLDEIGGQIIDEPVSLIREKLEEVIG